MSTVNFAQMVSGGMAVFAPMIYAAPVVYPLHALAHTYLDRRTTSGSVRIVLQFADTPAPRDRTIILGGQSRTITSG